MRDDSACASKFDDKAPRATKSGQYERSGPRTAISSPADATRISFAGPCAGGGPPRIDPPRPGLGARFVRAAPRGPYPACPAPTPSGPHAEARRDHVARQRHAARGQMLRARRRGDALAAIHHEHCQPQVGARTRWDRPWSALPSRSRRGLAPGHTPRPGLSSGSRVRSTCSLLAAHLVVGWAGPTTRAACVQLSSQVARLVGITLLSA